MKLFCLTVLGMLVHLGSANAQAVKNVTEVIPGKLARAGSTNRQPYSDATLRELCEQGYTLAVYVYARKPTKTVECSRGSIRYVQQGGWAKPESILAQAEPELRGKGRVMFHCWYGVHASNFLTAAGLNRVCGWSGPQAAEKFNREAPPGISTNERNELIGKLQSLGGGGSPINGCPSPR